MNSKSEYHDNKLSRIVIKDPRKRSVDTEYGETVADRSLLDKVVELRKMKGVTCDKKKKKRCVAKLEKCAVKKGKLE